MIEASTQCGASECRLLNCSQRAPYFLQIHSSVAATRAMAAFGQQETSGDDFQDQPVDGGAAPQTETDAEPLAITLTLPPMTADAPYGEGHRVTCWVDGCNCSRPTCASLLHHIRTKHAPKKWKVPGAWTHTPFMKKVRLELGEQQTTRRQNPKPKKAKAKTTQGVPPAAVNAGQHVAQQGSGTASVPESVQQSIVNVASSFTCGSTEKVIDMPGSSAPLVIPGSAFSELVAFGLLQVTSTGQFQWIYYLLL